MDKLNNSLLSFGFTLMFCQGMQIFPMTDLFQNSGFFSPLKMSWHYIFGRIHNLVAFSAYTLHFELKGINRQLRGLNNSGLLLSLSSKLGRIVDFDCCLNSYEFYIFISFFFSNTNVDHKNFIAEIWTLHSWMCYSNFRKVNRLSLYRKGEETWWNINR